MYYVWIYCNIKGTFTNPHLEWEKPKRGNKKAKNQTFLLRIGSSTMVERLDIQIDFQHKNCRMACWGPISGVHAHTHSALRCLSAPSPVGPYSKKKGTQHLCTVYICTFTACCDRGLLMTTGYDATVLSFIAVTIFGLSESLALRNGYERQFMFKTM